MTEVTSSTRQTSAFTEQLALTQKLLGQNQLAEAASALATLEALQSESTEALWCRLLRLQYQGMSPVSPQLLHEAEALLIDCTAQASEPLLRAQALLLKASLLNKCRLFELALRTLGQASAEAAQAGLREQEIQAQATITRVLYDAEMHQERIAHGEQFLRHYPDASLESRAAHYNYIGGAHKWLGRNELAISYYRRAVEETRHLNNPNLDELLLTNLANALAWVSGFEESQALLDACEAQRPLAQLAPDKRLWRMQAKALLHWKQKRYDEAFHWFGQAAEVGRQDPALRVGLIAALTRTAEAAQECGREGLGLSAALELVKLIERRGQEQANVQGAALLEIVNAAQTAAEKEALKHQGLRLEQQVKARTQELSATLARLQAEVEMRRATEKALQAAHDELEQRVQERTAELQRAMAALVQREKLAALGSLVAGVAHELNTPIGNALLAATSLHHRADVFRQQLDLPPLKRTVLMDFVAATHDSCELIETSLQRGAQLVSSFKTMANQDGEEARRDFVLGELIEETLAPFESRLRLQAVQLHVDCPGQLPCFGAPGALGRVLACLIDNALFHAFDEACEAPSLHIRATVDEPWVQIEVRDNGKGIPPEMMGRLFEPFFTTRLGQGSSGLGLHVAHNLVTGVLGGDITVAPDTAKGCCFVLRLPRRWAD